MKTAARRTAMRSKDGMEEEKERASEQTGKMYHHDVSRGSPCPGNQSASVTRHAAIVSLLGDALVLCYLLT